MEFSFSSCLVFSSNISIAVSLSEALASWEFALSQLLSQEELSFPLNHSAPFHFLHREVSLDFPLCCRGRILEVGPRDGERISQGPGEWLRPRFSKQYLRVMVRKGLPEGRVTWQVGRGWRPPAHCWAFTYRLDPEFSAGPRESIPTPSSSFIH